MAKKNKKPTKPASSKTPVAKPQKNRGSVSRSNKPKPHKSRGSSPVKPKAKERVPRQSKLNQYVQAQSSYQVMAETARSKNKIAQYKQAQETFKVLAELAAVDALKSRQAHKKRLKPRPATKYNALKRDVYKYLREDGKRVSMGELAKITSDLYTKLKVKYRRGEDKDELFKRAIKESDVILEEYFEPEVLVKSTQNARWWELDNLMSQIPPSEYVVIDNSDVLSGANERFEGNAFEATRFARSTYTEINSKLKFHKDYFDYLMIFFRDEESSKEFVCLLLLEEGSRLLDAAYPVLKEEMDNRFGLKRILKHITGTTPSERSLYKKPKSKRKTKAQIKHEHMESLNALVKTLKSAGFNKKEINTILKKNNFLEKGGAV